MACVVQTMQGSECLLEAVEQQDLDTVQILLYQFSADELDLNTPNSQGLTPLDVAVMTNNTPIAKLLLKAGGKEGPHCKYQPSSLLTRALLHVHARNVHSPKQAVYSLVPPAVNLHCMCEGRQTILIESTQAGLHLPNWVSYFDSPIAFILKMDQIFLRDFMRSLAQNHALHSQATEVCEASRLVLTSPVGLQRRWKEVQSFLHRFHFLCGHLKCDSKENKTLKTTFGLHST